MKKYLASGFIILTAIVGIGCGSSSEPSDSDVNRLNDVAEGDSTSNTSPSAAVAKVIDAGTWEISDKENLVKKKITLGTYVITAVEGGFGCAWEVVRNFTGEGNYFITGGFTEPGKTNTVTITNKAKGLELTGECLAAKKKE